MEDTITFLLDPNNVPNEDLRVACEAVYNATFQLAQLRAAWLEQRDAYTRANRLQLNAAVEEAEQAIDAKMRAAALQHLRGSIDAARAHLSATFTRAWPCPCSDKALEAALGEAERWCHTLTWTNMQRKVWISLAQTLATSLQLNCDGMGKDSFDAERSLSRAALHGTVQAAEKLLAGIPLTVQHSRDHVMLESQLRRAASAWAELDRLWGTEWKARLEQRRWVPDEERAACKQCCASFGWWCLRRRHHCRQCGEIFCARCLHRQRPLPSLAYPDPVKVCSKCFAMSPPQGPKPVTPSTVPSLTVKPSVFKATVLSKLY